MVTRIRVSALLAVCASASILAPAASAAQRWGREAVPRAGVCFYEDSNYNGDYFCVRPGENFASVPDGMNDRISSIRVFGNAEVSVFSLDRFDGSSTRFDSSIRNLREEGWNDRISSFRVWNGPQDGRSRDRGPEDRGFPPEREGPPERRVPQGRDVPQERGIPPERAVPPDRGAPQGRGVPQDRGARAEAIVRRAYQDILHRDPDSGGLSQYRSRIIDDGWTEEQVRESLRSSPEFREQSVMTGEKAQQIVRQAYLAVLKREPDSGSQGYVDRVLRDHWSQQDVERELRNSAEFRNKNNR